MTMEAVQQSILNDLALLGDSLNRMEYLLECGKETPGLSPTERAAAETVPDCQVNTWIDAKWSNGVLTLRTDSESLIVRGALALLEEIFSALQRTFDYVIIDTPPVSVVTDAAVISRISDGVLLIVRPGVTTIQGAQLSKKNLEAVNAHILGVVMNGYNAKKTGRKDGYSYAYSYGYYDNRDTGDK